MLHLSRNTVAKYADVKDMSPVAPMPQRRDRPALRATRHVGTEMVPREEVGRDV